MRHIISILLENESGALSRVSGLFSARGYNIETLTGFLNVPGYEVNGIFIWGATAMILSEFLVLCTLNHQG